jgi:hypothetical protein
VSDGGPSHDTAVRTGAGLEVRLVIVPLPDEAGGSVRDRQITAIVRLLRSAAEHHTPAIPERDQELEIHGCPWSDRSSPPARRTHIN